MERKGNQIKFYADTPAGDRNKKFTYSAHNFEHAADIAAKFIQEKNFKIRAAYYINTNGISMRIDKVFNLTKHNNSLIEKQDQENRLRIISEKNSHNIFRLKRKIDN